MTGKIDAIRPSKECDLDRIVQLQQRAYAANRIILGVEPLPLMVDYRDLLRRMNTWVVDADVRLAAVLIMEFRPDDALIWSIASDPDHQGSGLGTRLMLHVETMAKSRHLRTIRLYTGARLTDRIAWYARLGFTPEREERLSDRSVIHMVKTLV